MMIITEIKFNRLDYFSGNSKVTFKLDVLCLRVLSLLSVSQCSPNNHLNLTKQGMVYLLQPVIVPTHYFADLAMKKHVVQVFIAVHHKSHDITITSLRAARTNTHTYVPLSVRRRS